MINAWSLLYDEIYGDDEMSPCKTDHIDDDFMVGLSTASAGTNVFTVDTSNFDNVSINTSESDDFITIAGGENTVYDFDDLDFDASQFAVAAEPVAVAAEPVAAAESVPVTPTKPVEEETEDMDFDMEWD